MAGVENLGQLLGNCTVLFHREFQSQHSVLLLQNLFLKKCVIIYFLVMFKQWHCLHNEKKKEKILSVPLQEFCKNIAAAVKQE